MSVPFENNLHIHEMSNNAVIIFNQMFDVLSVPYNSCIFDRNLRWNKLQDVIPPEIGELKKLTHL